MVLAGMSWRIRKLDDGWGLCQPTWPNSA